VPFVLTKLYKAPNIIRSGRKKNHPFKDSFLMIIWVPEKNLGNGKIKECLSKDAISIFLMVAPGRQNLIEHFSSAQVHYVYFIHYFGRISSDREGNDRLRQGKWLF
jgi:hypothetical protein